MVNGCIDPAKMNTIRKLMEGSVQEILNNGIMSQKSDLLWWNCRRLIWVKKHYELWHGRGHLKMTKLTARYIVYWSWSLDKVMVCIWPHSDQMPLSPAENILWLRKLQRKKTVSYIQKERSFCSWQRSWAASWGSLWRITKYPQMPGSLGISPWGCEV